jgi:hypothetical protein
MKKDPEEKVIVYLLDDYRKPKSMPIEEKEDDRYDVVITMTSEDEEISVSKNLWNTMVECGYEPTDFEEHARFLEDLEEN